MVLNSFDQGSALFILVEAPPIDLLEIKILFNNNHLPKTGTARVLSLSSLAETHLTKPQVSGGATPSCFFGATSSCLFFAATSMLALVLMLQLDLDTLPHI